jgi:hypothetical protein
MINKQTFTSQNIKADDVIILKYKTNTGKYTSKVVRVTGLGELQINLALSDKCNKCKFALPYNRIIQIEKI